MLRMVRVQKPTKSPNIVYQELFASVDIPYVPLHTPSFKIPKISKNVKLDEVDLEKKSILTPQLIERPIQYETGRESEIEKKMRLLKCSEGTILNKCRGGPSNETNGAYNGENSSLAEGPDKGVQVAVGPSSSQTKHDRHYHNTHYGQKGGRKRSLECSGESDDSDDYDFSQMKITPALKIGGERNSDFDMPILAAHGMELSPASSAAKLDNFPHGNEGGESNLKNSDDFIDHGCNVKKPSQAPKPGGKRKSGEIGFEIMPNLAPYWRKLKSSIQYLPGKGSEHDIPYKKNRPCEDSTSSDGEGAYNLFAVTYDSSHSTVKRIKKPSGQVRGESWMNSDNSTGYGSDSRKSSPRSGDTESDEDDADVLVIGLTEEELKEFP